MTGLLDKLTSLPAGWVYLTVAALVFAEDALFVGFVVPGETAAILGGVTASTHHTNLPTMILTVVLAAVLGDTVGYEIGAHLGVRILEVRPLSRRRDQIDRARTFLAKHGGPAVFLGRFVAFLRAMMPFLAGTARMRYRTFLAYNASGGIIWGTSMVLIGYIAGLSYKKVASTFGVAAAAVLAILVIAALIVVRVRRNRADRQ